MAQKALSLNAPKAEVYGLLGGIKMAQGKIGECIALREKAVSLKPNDPVMNALLAVALVHGGKPEEAIVIFKKAIRADPIPPLWFLNFLGMAYRVTGNIEKAIETFNSVITRNPNYWLSHFGLAVCYGLSGHEDKARASAAEVLRIRPKFRLAQIKTWPDKDKAKRDACLEALRKAGLK